MREDPGARRNRGSSAGPWVLGGLVVAVIVLVAIMALRPVPSPAASEARPAPVSVEQRVADDQRAQDRRDADRHAATP